MMASAGRAYAQRKIAAVAGSTLASRTRIPEKAIDIAPSTAVITGRSERARKTQANIAGRVAERCVVRHLSRDRDSDRDRHVPVHRHRGLDSACPGPARGVAEP